MSNQDVKWIKLKVGMFDGASFKRIKRAKIGGESFRDKLTAVWFELLDLAGKCNRDGFLINDELPYRDLEDVAIMLDREKEEVELCINYYINNGMVEIINDCYCLANWIKYQSVDGLDKIREQGRERIKRFREKKTAQITTSNCNVTCNATVTYPSQDINIYSNSNSNSSNCITSNSIDGMKDESSREESRKFKKPTIEEVFQYVYEQGYQMNSEAFYDFYESKNWMVGKNKMKDWKAAVRNWHRNEKNKNTSHQNNRKSVGGATGIVV